MRISPLALINTFLFPLSVWADTVWDLDFTETEPLEPWLAEEITAEGPGAFTRLYQALQPFAAQAQESTEVTPPGHGATHAHFVTSVWP